MTQISLLVDAEAFYLNKAKVICPKIHEATLSSLYDGPYDGVFLCPLVGGRLRLLRKLYL